MSLSALGSILPVLTLFVKRVALASFCVWGWVWGAQLTYSLPLSLLPTFLSAQFLTLSFLVLTHQPIFPDQHHTPDLSCQGPVYLPGTPIPFFMGLLKVDKRVRVEELPLTYTLQTFQVSVGQRSQGLLCHLKRHCHWHPCMASWKTNHLTFY